MRTCAVEVNAHMEARRQRAARAAGTRGQGALPGFRAAACNCKWWITEVRGSKAAPYPAQWDGIAIPFYGHPPVDLE